MLRADKTHDGLPVPFIRWRRVGSMALCLLLGIPLAPMAFASGPPLSDRDFVQVTPTPAGTPSNDQPIHMEPMLLKTALSTLTVRADGGNTKQKVFSEDGLDKLYGPLLKNLATAGPQEDIVFAITDQGKTFGSRLFGIGLRQVRVTTGRAFYRAGKLQIIFGQMHEPYKSEELSTGRAILFRPGVRASRISTGWTVDEIEGVTRQADRGDWVKIALANESTKTTGTVGQSVSIPAATPESAPTDANGLAARIKMRLQALKKLHEDGLISDDEYRTRRTKILDGI